MSRKQTDSPNAAEFMRVMRGLPADVVARAMTRACVNAVNFAGCSKSLLANSWANACTTDHHRARFEAGTTLATLRADADAFLRARQPARF